MTKNTLKIEGITAQAASAIMIGISVFVENDIVFMIAGFSVVLYGLFRATSGKPYPKSPSGILRILFGIGLAYILVEYSLEIHIVAIILGAIGINIYTLVNGFLPDGFRFKIKSK